MAARKPTGSAVATRRESLPVDVSAILERQKQAVMEKIGKPSGTVINIKQNKTMVLPSGDITSEPQEMVILDFVSMNTLYDGVYDPNNVQPPICFAIGENPDNLIASDASPDKQSETCATCPMNRYETAARGKGKACKNMRVLAVMPVDATDEDSIWLLRVSPTGLKAYDGYIRKLAQQNGLAPIQVVTKIGFDPNEEYPSLRFAPASTLDPDRLGFFVSRLEEAANLIRTEPDYSQYESQDKKPAGKKPVARRR